MPDWLLPTVTGLGGVVLGGVILSIISQILADRSERRRMRRDVLRKLAGHRYLLTMQFMGCDGEVWVALNEVVAAFADDEKVMDALRTFRRHVDNGFRAMDLYPLIRAMAKAAKMPADSIDSAIVENPFVPPASNN